MTARDYFLKANLYGLLLAGCYWLFNIMKTMDTKTINSVEVLTDASATAQYGKKGRHGVVIITTKK